MSLFNQKIKKIIYLERLEEIRQIENLSLIASESLAYEEVLKISSSVLTNKYAEGYPGKRYYGGCKYIDEIENIAIEEAKKAFSCNFANVQPLSGSTANFAIYQAFLSPKDVILSMQIDAGGHLTHSSKFSFVNYIYTPVTYTIDKNGILNYKQIRELALSHKPKLIIAGGSSYPLQLDFKKFREIADEIGAILLGDICHLSGLIISKAVPDCFPHCHVAMSTTHKQLMGPRGAIILWNDEKYTTQINRSVFPGTQGGPQSNLIAGKAISLAKANEIGFKEIYSQVVKNAKAMAEEFLKLGVNVFANTTETHLLIVNVFKTYGFTGDIAQDSLEKINLTVNKNLIFGDSSPLKPSAIRIGTIIGTQRNLKEKEFRLLAQIIDTCFKNLNNQTVLDDLKQQVLSLLGVY